MDKLLIGQQLTTLQLRQVLLLFGSLDRAGDQLFLLDIRLELLLVNFGESVSQDGENDIE